MIQISQILLNNKMNKFNNCKLNYQKKFININNYKRDLMLSLGNFKMI